MILLYLYTSASCITSIGYYHSLYNDIVHSLAYITLLGSKIQYLPTSFLQKLSNSSCFDLLKLYRMPSEVIRYIQYFIMS